MEELIIDIAEVILKYQQNRDTLEEKIDELESRLDQIQEQQKEIKNLLKK